MQSAAVLERRTEAEDTRDEIRQKRLHMARIKTKKDDEEKFNNILDCCKRILSTAMDDGNNIFELLDPLISDTQCHLHSILILNVLHKCYNNNKSHYYGIDKLNERDEKIISYAVLFSLLKLEYRDNFGFILHQVSIDHFYGLKLSSKKREQFNIAEAKKKFNSYSVEYLKSISRENIKTILDECRAVTTPLRLTLLPCYATILTIIDYMKQRKLPIILSLVSVRVKDVAGGVTKYNMISNEVRYYEYQEKENKFFHKKELSENEKKIPTIIFSCYSQTTGDRTEGFEIDLDIRNLLLSCSAGEVQLPRNAKLPVDYEDGEEYVSELYGKVTDVLMSYRKNYELAKKLKRIDAQYSRIVHSSVEQGGDHSSFTIERRREECPAVIDHVYLSNYFREYQRLKNLDFNSEIHQHEVFEFNKKTETLEISRKLDVYKNL